MGGLMGSYSLHAESTAPFRSDDKYNVNQGFKTGIGPLMIGIIGAVVVLVAFIWRSH